jgi:hypothetical protein
MKTMAAAFLAVFTVMTAEAGPQTGRGYVHHNSAFRSRSSSTHFIARAGNGFHRRFHYGSGGVIIFDSPDYGDDYGLLDDGGEYGLPDDGTVYPAAEAPQDVERLPYATPTSDPEIVISPFEPHATISVAGIPHGAKVQDPVSNLVFLNP